MNQQEFQGAALQLLPDQARLPRLSPTPLIFRAISCSLHITSPLLCPQAAKQEYDQVILMFTGPSFSKTIFSNAELQNVLSSCANEFTAPPQPEKSSNRVKFFRNMPGEWPIAS
jgi:hypothetical protein